MTNFLPTLSVSMQAIHPSLAAAASRMTGEEFGALSSSVVDRVARGGYAKLTMILDGRGIEPLPEVVSQICIGRQLFLGEALPYNFVNALARLPQTYGNEMIDHAFKKRTWICEDGLKILSSDHHAIAQDLVDLCGPYFHGDFSLLLTRLDELNTRRGDEVGLLSFNLGGPSTEELRQALNLPEGFVFLLSAFHCIPLTITRNFSIRRLAHSVGNNPLSSMTVPQMREIFFRGFHCTDESIRQSYLRLAPALCADPSVEEGVKVGCLVAARNAAADDPSPAIRQLAEGALISLSKLL